MHVCGRRSPQTTGITIKSYDYYSRYEDQQIPILIIVLVFWLAVVDLRFAFLCEWNSLRINTIKSIDPFDFPQLGLVFYGALRKFIILLMTLRGKSISGARSLCGK